MSLPDATAGATIASGSFSPAWMAFLDFAGDPVRATTAPYSLTVASSGDPELDGYTFDAVDPTMVSVGDVKNAEGGSETLTFMLSGIVGPDSDLLNTVGDTSLWRGRTARLWAVIYDEAGVQQGAIWPVYTGRMSALQIGGSPSAQTVKLDVENYLASLKQASGRTYLGQKSFDPIDNTAALTIGVANGATKGVAGAVPTPSWWGRLPYNFQVPF
ncbi:MAG: hypothetical protein WCZ28_11415 [Burkholderiaceae bacterium]